MKNLYLYLTKEDFELCIKYGIKLSQFTDKILILSGSTKKGIISYLSPKDSDKYLDSNYICVRINSENLNIFIYDESFENTNFLSEKICRLQDYVLGEYQEPIALICSTVLPENIFLYNKKLDSPLLVEDSKDFYYSKCINYMIESGMFSNMDLFSTMLKLGKQKGLFEDLVDDTNSSDIKIVIDKKSNKKYIENS